MSMTTDEKYMRAALKQAEKAYNLGETPIGCVIVHEDKIIARGYNRRNTDKNPLAHAEVAAIKKASKKLGDWRLEECTLYVTLEPCQMCAGAIVQSRIPRVVVGCMNPKAGCTGSILNLLDIQAFNHQADLTTGVLEEECSQLMKQFFNNPCSRGGSGTLNLQSAIAGVILRRGRQSAGLPPESDVDVWVSRDGTL